MSKKKRNATVTVEPTAPVPWHPDWMDDPKWQAEYARYKRRIDLCVAITKPLLLIPIVGRYVRDFWFLLISEGPYQTLKPRWGGITFSYLNDGFRPTVWHTWHQVTHEDDDYTGIYTTGAPSSLAQAIEWEEKWAKERERKVNRPS